MRSVDLRSLLGGIVASAAVGGGAGACGARSTVLEPEPEPSPQEPQQPQPQQPGRLGADGARVEGARETHAYGFGDPKCEELEWIYELAPAHACDLSRQWAKDNYRLPCAQLCGDDADGCVVQDRAERNVATHYTPVGQSCPGGPGFLRCSKTIRGGCAIEGRRPDGLVAIESPAFASVGAYLARCAYLEAAAVAAFERLVLEAKAHHAPAELVDRLRRAAREERRHTELATGLAQRFGATPHRPTVDQVPTRTLFEIARENMIEGVIRETYGAAVALWRAAHASDAGIATAMREIAEDECRHAVLSWDLAEWLEARLTTAERGELSRAAAAARAELREQLVLAEPPAELARVAGVPTGAVASALVDRLDETAWSSLTPPRQVVSGRVRGDGGARDPS